MGTTTAWPWTCAHKGCARITVYKRLNQDTGEVEHWCMNHFEKVRQRRWVGPGLGHRYLKAMANFHDACLLHEYLDSESPEYQRDLNQYGVYVIFELIENKLVPLFVEPTPKYVGMSTVLSSRLRQHNLGINSTPAQVAVSEWLRDNATQEEVDVYQRASEKERRGFKAQAIQLRRLWVRTAHTEDRKQALQLEQSLIHLIDTDPDLPELWNHIRYVTTYPFQPPKRPIKVEDM